LTKPTLSTGMPSTMRKDFGPAGCWLSLYLKKQSSLPLMNPTSGMIPFQPSNGNSTRRVFNHRLSKLKLVLFWFSLQAIWIHSIEPMQSSAMLIIFRLYRKVKVSWKLKLLNSFIFLNQLLNKHLIWLLTSTLILRTRCLMILFIEDLYKEMNLKSGLSILQVFLVKVQIVLSQWTIQELFSWVQDWELWLGGSLTCLWLKS
jgi:hypothetical protein